jgi:hypothetical protein
MVTPDIGLYEVPMHPLLYRLVTGFAVCCFVGSAVSAVLCSILGVSVRKGRLRLLSLCLLGGGAIVSALAIIAYQRSLPVYHGEGIIQHARLYTTGKEHRTSLQIATNSGAELVLRASGRSIYFHPGEHLIVTYQGETGSIINATFLKDDGSVEGQFRGTGLWPAYVLLIGGILIIYLGLEMNRRNPEGTEERNRNAKPYGQIDSASFMRLSGRRHEDREP